MPDMMNFKSQPHISSTFSPSTELKILRTNLGLTVNDFAEYIAGYSERTCFYWEEGTSLVPQAVLDELKRLNNEIQLLISSIFSRDKTQISLPFFENYEHFHKVFESSSPNIAKWKIWQSFISRLYILNVSSVNVSIAPKDSCNLYKTDQKIFESFAEIMNSIDPVKLKKSSKKKSLN